MSREHADTLPAAVEKCEGGKRGHLKKNLTHAFRLSYPFASIPIDDSR